MAELLTPERLDEIRERTLKGWPVPGPDSVYDDVDALLSHIAGLQLLIADLLSPAGDGSEEAVRLYRAGVEDETRRIVEWLRAEASRAMSAGAVVTAQAHRHAADLVESPPAPAAAPG